MALVVCPDCGSEVSDAAANCPRCARPLSAGGFASTEVPSDPELGADPADATQEPLSPRPWVRYWARMLDVIPVAFLTGVLVAVVIPGYLDDPDSGYGVTWLSFLVWIPLEAFMLASWGTSPGKALLKTRVLKEDGTRLEFGEAVRRSGRVWFFGLGTGFPLISAFTMARAHRRLTKEGKTSWDRDLGLRLQHEPVGVLRVAAAVAILVGVFVLSFVSA